jgi:hypothetical protein
LMYYEASNSIESAITNQSWFKTKENRHD